MTRSRLLSALVALTCVSLMISGCAGKTKQDGPDEPDAVAPTATVDQETGAIDGALVGDDGLPISGAQVALQEAPALTSVTATDGQFAFSYVDPGTYHVLVAALGFGHRSVRAEVMAGEVTHMGDIVLQAAAPSGQAIERIIGPIPGKFFCGFATAAVSGPCKVVYFPEGSPLHPAEEAYQGTANENNIFTFANAIVDNRSLESDVFSGMILEVSWTFQTQAAKSMTATIEETQPNGRQVDPVEGLPVVWARGKGESPLRLIALPGQDNANQTEQMPLDAQGFTLGVFPATDPSGPEVEGRELQPTAYTEQPFELWLTLYYNQPVDLTFSALPDA